MVPPLAPRTAHRTPHDSKTGGKTVHENAEGPDDESHQGPWLMLLAVEANEPAVLVFATAVLNVSQLFAQ